MSCKADDDVRLADMAEKLAQRVTALGVSP
jgi:hypothetical protein